MEAQDFDTTIPNAAFVNDGSMKGKVVTIDYGYTLLLQSDGLVVLFFRV